MFFTLKFDDDKTYYEDMYSKLQRDCTATLLLRKINYFLNKHPNVFTFLYLSYVKIIDCEIRPMRPRAQQPSHDRVNPCSGTARIS